MLADPWASRTQFLFMGPTFLDVMDQYTYVAGRPAMMPYWSLGFDQCKWLHSQPRSSGRSGRWR